MGQYWERFTFVCGSVHSYPASRFLIDAVAAFGNVCTLSIVLRYLMYVFYALL